MNKKLYNLMDWAAIEEIVYAEANHPEEILGPHVIGNNTLIQTFIPGASQVTLKLKDSKDKSGKTYKDIKMEEADEEGFFAVLVPGKITDGYFYHVSFKDKKKKAKDIKECYNFSSIMKEKDKDLFLSGSLNDLYNRLGSKRMTRNGVHGTNFLVWAPNALRVSVLLDINNFDGRMHQMIRDDATGIYELFVPGVDAGDNYQFEILIKGGEKLLRTDPYATQTSWDEEMMSSVLAEYSYKWNDSKWMKERALKDYKKLPLNIYEVNIATYMENASFADAKEDIISHMRECGYTHLLLNPILEYYNDSNGYKPSYLFALDHRLGDIAEFMNFVDELHQSGFGVILDMPFNAFDDGSAGMGYYDGSCLYGHEDPRKGIDPRNGGRIFQYGNPVVDSFLLSCANYWADKFHIDGYRLLEVSSMLYLDYYREQWIPNIYGSNENLEAISFIKKYNMFLHKNFSGFISIADEETGWNNITVRENMSKEEVEDCLGFDFVPDYGFNKDIIPYVSSDPILRQSMHDNLVMNFNYINRENYIYTLSHRDVDFGKNGIFTRMFGENDKRLANLKLFYSYLISHPGKNMIFMGQDEGCYDSFTPGENYNFNNTCEYQKEIKTFIKDMMKLNSEKAYVSYDYDINAMTGLRLGAYKDNVLVYTKNGKNEVDTLTFVFNFADKEYSRYRIPVSSYGKYKEIFNTDAKKYGGDNRLNEKILKSRIGEFDGFSQSLSINLAPLSVSVFAYEPFTKEELDLIEKKRKEKEKLIQNRQKKMNEFLAEKNKIKESLKDELARKFMEAESLITEGSEIKSKKKK